MKHYDNGNMNDMPTSMDNMIRPPNGLLLVNSTLEPHSEMPSECAYIYMSKTLALLHSAIPNMNTVHFL